VSKIEHREQSFFRHNSTMWISSRKEEQHRTGWEYAQPIDENSCRATARPDNCFGANMRDLFSRLVPIGILCFLALSTAAQAQSDPAKFFKTNCTLCHSPDGSGDSATGRAMHAKDLRSEEVQKQSDAALSEVIAKGRGKMPAFGGKIKPDDMPKMIAFIRSLPKK
jgi:mono/diheme cytochrome c family protein